jgi:hypothetical protein
VQPEAQPEAIAATAETVPVPESAPVALRGTQAPAKPKLAPVVRTAAARPQLKQPTAPPKAVATAAPAAKSHNQLAKREPPSAAAEIRTAYSAPQTTGSGLLAGAQPVLQAGSFDARWSGLH